jgi:hypothetical protein
MGGNGRGAAAYLQRDYTGIRGPFGPWEGGGTFKGLSRYTWLVSTLSGELSRGDFPKNSLERNDFHSASGETILTWMLERESKMMDLAVAAKSSSM